MSDLDNLDVIDAEIGKLHARGDAPALAHLLERYREQVAAREGRERQALEDRCFCGGAEVRR